MNPSDLSNPSAPSGHEPPWAPQRAAVQLAAGQLMGPPMPARHVGHARLRVIAYDIQEPRRAARVRRLLRRWAVGDGQYSVFELQLAGADLYSLIDAVHARLDARADKLALWQPARQLAWRLDANSAAAEFARWPAYRQWVLAYDIREASRLAHVQRAVASHSVAVQRSVYVLHGPVAQARNLTKSVTAMMRDDDRLAVWPLLSAAHLWMAQAAPTDCVAIGQPAEQGHLWPRPTGRARPADVFEPGP